MQVPRPKVVPLPRPPMPKPQYFMMAAHAMHGAGRLVTPNDRSIEAQVKDLAAQRPSPGSPS